MKKLLLVGAFATFGVLALSSCKKDYKCTIGTGANAVTVNYPGLNKADAETAETACKAGTGVWAEQ